MNEIHEEDRASFAFLLFVLVYGVAWGVSEHLIGEAAYFIYATPLSILLGAWVVATIHNMTGHCFLEPVKWKLSGVVGAAFMAITPLAASCVIDIWMWHSHGVTTLIVGFYLAQCLCAAGLSYVCGKAEAPSKREETGWAEALYLTKLNMLYLLQRTAKNAIVCLAKARAFYRKYFCPPLYRVLNPLFQKYAPNAV